MARIFHKIGGRHSEQLVTPKTTIVNGETIKVPGVSVEFSNHICVTEDPEVLKAVKASPYFGKQPNQPGKSMWFLPDDAPIPEPSGPHYTTGQATVAGIEGKKKKG